MAQLSEIENQLLERVKEGPLQTSLALIRQAVEKIWAPDAPRIIRDFTDHGVPHYERLAGHAAKLLLGNRGGEFSPQEMYLLLAGIYLHDIGMQCDVVRFPEIKTCAESLGAKFDVDFRAHSASDYNFDEQKALRKNHQYLSAAWILHTYRTRETPLELAAKSIPQELVEDLMDVCMFHSKLSIINCPRTFKFDETGRKQLVAALVRFSDELDIDANRVSIEVVKTFSLDPQNSVYWWLHNRTKLVFLTPNVIQLNIRLHPDDVKHYGSFVHSAFITEFQSKNRPVLTILALNHIPIVFSDDSKVIEDHLAEVLPPDVLKVMSTGIAQEPGIAHVARVVGQMGFAWDYLATKIDGTDGWIRFHRHARTYLVGVQVLTGDDRVVQETKTDYIVRANPWKTWSIPQLVVWYSRKRNKAYWREIYPESTIPLGGKIPISKRSTFGTHIKGQLYRLARNFLGDYGALPVFLSPVQPTIRVSAIKEAAWEFYTKWRREGCTSPVFGTVLITLRGWRHLTAVWRTQADVVRKLELLGSARTILECFDRYHICRKEPRTGPPRRIFYEQRAIIRYPHRRDAIVSVIGEKLADRKVRFYSVYERPEKETKGSEKVHGV